MEGESVLDAPDLNAYGPAVPVPFSNHPELDLDASVATALSPLTDEQVAAKFTLRPLFGEEPPPAHTASGGGYAKASRASMAV